jgi:hypothetical protein
MICNKFYKKNIRQRIGPFMYFSIINGHIISIELESNFFNDLTSFNTNARSCNEDVLINLNVLDAWYSGIDKIMYVANCVTNFLNANICFNFIFIAINNYGF